MRGPKTTIPKPLFIIGHWLDELATALILRPKAVFFRPLERDDDGVWITRSRPNCIIRVRHGRIKGPPVVRDYMATMWLEVDNESDMIDCLDGNLAEVIMPAKCLPVRIWRRLFPPKPIEMELG